MPSFANVERANAMNEARSVPRSLLREETFVDHSRYFLSLLSSGLIIVGFLASSIAINVLNPKAITVNGSLVANKTALYYLAHLLEISTLLLCGGITWLLINRHQRRKLLLPLTAYFVVGAIMMFRGLTADQILSAKLASSTGILPCLLSVVIVFGAYAPHWKLADRLIDLTAYSLVGMLIFASLRHPFHTRDDAVANLQGYLIAMYVPAAWTILKPISKHNWVSNILRFLPIMAYAVGSILTQTRLNLVLLLPIFGIYMYVQSRRGKAASSAVPIVIVILGGLLAAPFLLSSRVGESLAWSWLGLVHRLGSDTRTQQIIAYFTDMSFTDLLVGRGTEATYMWAGRSWTGGIDVGYLMLLLYGGVPLLLTYYFLHISPGIKAFRHPMSARQFTCGACVVVWAIRMLSTGYMDYNPGYYCFLLCVAGCLPVSSNA